MDTRDGRITTADQVSMMPPEDQRYMRLMAIPPTRGQLRAGAVGRNDPCPCGSGAKFKTCCMARPPRRHIPSEHDK